MDRQSEKKTLLNSSISSTCVHNMVNIGPLAGEIRWRVWGTPTNFNRASAFVTAPTSLNGGQPNFARCLAVSWAGTLYIHFRRLLTPNGILQDTFRPSFAFFHIGSASARHLSSGRQPNCGVVQEMELRNFRKGRHLYSTGRPSRRPHSVRWGLSSTQQTGHNPPQFLAHVCCG